MAYCGTCKTMGAIYGHPSRVLLNHDTVFLAEVLQWLSGEQQGCWEYRSFNCLTTPREADILPVLDFVAAANVILVHFRIIDHYSDSKQRFWLGLQRLLSPTYRRALGRLSKWNFPIDDLTRILSAQSRLEAAAQSLHHVAEPTATATAMFFAHGARVAGRGDAAEQMYRVGHHFGFLVYTLDAYEDRNADARSGDFNVLLKFPEIDGKVQILQLLNQLELELPPHLAVRLRTNVEERMGLRPRVLQQRCRASRKDRWRNALDFARTLRDREPAGVIKGSLVFASTALMAFLVPHHVRGAESWRHCMGLSMNLMAVAAVFASSPGVPPSVTTDGKTPRQNSSWCGGCSGCDCDDCDCPCDSCDCS